MLLLSQPSKKKSISMKSWTSTMTTILKIMTRKINKKLKYQSNSKKNNIVMSSLLFKIKLALPMFRPPKNKILTISLKIKKLKQFPQLKKLL